MQTEEPLEMETSGPNGGDAAVDAELYRGSGRRSDHSVYEKLYGLHPGIVLTISKSFATPPKLFKLTCLDHKPTIAILNTHASITTSKYKVGSNKFYALFTDFVKTFKESGHDEGYLYRNVA